MFERQQIKSMCKQHFPIIAKDSTHDDADSLLCKHLASHESRLATQSAILASEERPITKIFNEKYQ